MSSSVHRTIRIQIRARPNRVRTYLTRRVLAYALCVWISRHHSVASLSTLNHLDFDLSDHEPRRVGCETAKARIMQGELTSREDLSLWPFGNPPWHVGSSDSGG